MNILLNATETYTCGTGTLVFEGIIPIIVSTIVTLIKIGVPILLIIFGMLDLGKAVMAQKDDEIKKGQKTFFTRLIAAVMVFLVVVIVQIAVRFIASSSDKGNIASCIDCFISGSESTNGAISKGCYKQQ